LAIQHYESSHGHLPPAVVYGSNGQPLYSWRVLILPHIEQQALYDEFKLDEPWDSPHNIRLLERMPTTYAPPRYKRSRYPAHHTILHVFVGPGTAFEGPGRLRWRDFTDGLSSTLLVVEAGDPVPWTKPEEIIYDSAQPVRLRGPFKDGFRAGLADASVRFISYDVDEAALRGAITRNGGENVRLD
jgi:Protein of unknown function (DUF1559)